MTENIKSQVETAQTQAAEFAQTAQTQMTDAAAKAQESLRDATEFARGNAEAFAESTRIAIEGFNSLANEWATFARSQMTEATEWSKRYAAVKSPTELVELNREAMQAGIDALVKQSSKATELGLKLANDATAPLSSRIAMGVDRLKTAA